MPKRIAIVEDEAELASLIEYNLVRHGYESHILKMCIRDSLGDKDEYIPFTEATNLQTALRNAGVKCEIIRIPNGAHGTGAWHTIPGVPDWERQMTEWLNTCLLYTSRCV